MASETENVINMLSSGAEVSEVLSISMMRVLGRVYVNTDMSSIHPATAQDLVAQASARGLHFLDTPVSGGILAIMAVGKTPTSSGLGPSSKR